MVKRVDSKVSPVPDETGTGGPAGPSEAKPGLAQTGHERRTQKSAAEAKVAKQGDRGAGATKPAGAAPAAEEIPSDAYVVSLPAFEGPLDLLLHLAQKHELDLLDIPIGFITEKYLEYLKVMQALTIDLASEYLVMAATLAHIKSKLLLPDLASAANVEGEEEEELDPRAELVRRLLEYQKYKVAAEQLGERDTLGANVFLRGTVEEAPDGPAPFAPFGVFNLLDAFKTVLERTNVKIEHEVVFDRVSISDRIVELTDLLKSRSNVPFEEIFVREGRAANRSDVIITFLAILEMCRLRMMRAYQADPLAPIYLDLLIVSEDGDPLDMLASQPPPARPADSEPAASEEPAEPEMELAAGEAAVLDEDPVAIEAPEIEDEPALTEEQPLASDERVAEPEPAAAEAEPVAAEAPVAIEDEPAEEEPAVGAEELAATDQPVAAEAPVAIEDEPAEEEPAVSAEELAATDEPVASEEPVALDGPTADSLAAAPDASPDEDVAARELSDAPAPAGAEEPEELAAPEALAASEEPEELTAPEEPEELAAPEEPDAQGDAQERRDETDDPEASQAPEDKQA